MAAAPKLEGRRGHPYKPSVPDRLVKTGPPKQPPAFPVRRMESCFHVVIGRNILRPSQTCRSTCEYLFSSPMGFTTAGNASLPPYAQKTGAPMNRSSETDAVQIMAMTPIYSDCPPEFRNTQPQSNSADVR